MIEFASCEWYEKNKLVYLINELKSNEKTLAEALLYLLIVSLFPVCKDENELYKDNPITNKKTVSADMKNSMSMKPFWNCWKNGIKYYLNRMYLYLICNT